MIATRLRQISLLLLSLALSAIIYFQMFERTYGYVPVKYVVILSVAAVLFVALWVLLLIFQPHANQTILPCVVMLTSIGTMMIIRIDYAAKPKTSVGYQQLVWLCLALVLTCVFVALLRDYRVLRRFSYLSMAIGLVLLFSPMIPGIGHTIGGARIWIGIGSHTLQPGEFAKLFLAVFFAAYLFGHRDQLAVGGKKILGMQLPRIKDLGPIALVWVASILVLVVQHDLGTSLMFFALFVSMLYVATGRKNWLVIGGVAFVAGAMFAAKAFAHVGYRVDGWLHAFDPKVYGREYGSSYQLVTGLFGMASGGLTGTGVGQGKPYKTPLANSDFIYASLGEELGLVGTLAILMLYLAIIATGFIVAMKVKDGFGKLLSSGLAFTMAFQIFTVVGGLTRVIPMTGLTMPYMAAGGSSLLANYLLAALLIIISNDANKPDQGEELSTTMQYEAILAMNNRAAAKGREETKKARHASNAVRSAGSGSAGATTGSASASNIDDVQNGSALSSQAVQAMKTEAIDRSGYQAGGAAQDSMGTQILSTNEPRMASSGQRPNRQQSDAARPGGEQL